MTAALVESLRRSAGADPSPEGAVKLPFTTYSRGHAANANGCRCSLQPGETEQKTGGLPQSRPRTQHHCPAVAIWVCFRDALKRAAPTRLTRAAGRGVNSPGFPRGVLGFSMIRIRWRFLSVTRRF